MSQTEIETVLATAARLIAPNEQHIHNLLLNHERRIRTARYTGSPSLKPFEELRAVRVINQRLEMLVELAREQDPDGFMTATELRAKTQLEAVRRAAICSRGEVSPENEGWEWASSASIAEYTGGTFGDDGASVQLPGLIEWRSRIEGGPRAIRYVRSTSAADPQAERFAENVEECLSRLVRLASRLVSAPTVELDCGDNSCLFAFKKGGMLRLDDLATKGPRK